MGSVSQVGLVFYSLILIIMSNMSYCRFQNTLSDLQDCWNAIDEHCLDLYEASCGDNASPVKFEELIERGDLSQDEADAMIDLVHLSRQIAEHFDGIDE